MSHIDLRPSWLRFSDSRSSKSNQAIYDKSEMLSYCENLKKPCSPTRYKMLLKTVPTLPLALDSKKEENEHESDPKPKVSVFFVF